MVKGVLSRYTLERNGITFNRDVIGSTELREILGKQAEILATRLLDFNRFAPQERAKTLMVSMDRNLSCRPNEDIEDPRGLHEITDLKARAVSACRHAQKIVVPLESRWMDFVKTLFEPMITRARDIEGAGRVGVRELAKSLRVHAGGDLIWDAADCVRSETAPFDAPKLTRPKPDLFISLPTIEEHRAPRGLAREPVLGNFRVDKLQLLEETMGVASSPLKFIGDRQVDEMDCLSFPCVVLEAKHHQVSGAQVEKCYWQAANGAASALALLNDLTVDCLDTGVKAEIRPVVIITLNGHRTRLWIAGIKSRKRVPEGDSNDADYNLPARTRVRYHMQCIWKGDLHIEESMTELICIIDSLEKWILDDFRPWVSGNLGRLYRKMDLKVENDGGGGDFSSNEEEASDDLQDSVSETSEEYVETDDEEKKWDEDWIASVSEESDSELDADSEDYDEYEQDLARADSLMEELSLDDTAMSIKSVRHRFIEVRRGLDV